MAAAATTDVSVVVGKPGQAQNPQYEVDPASPGAVLVKWQASKGGEQARRVREHTAAAPLRRSGSQPSASPSAQAASPDPDPMTTRYFLHATPASTTGGRRLAGDTAVAVVALAPPTAGTDGSAANPFTKLVHLPSARARGSRGVGSKGSNLFE